MNCKEAEIVITDLARNGPIEVEARENALGHLKVCEQCGARLAGEKRLSEGLLAWARESRGEQAPPGVEAKLRVAFRQRSKVRGRRRWIKIAAVGSIAAGILLFKLVSPPTLHAPAPVVVAPPSRAVLVAERAGAGGPPVRAVVKKKRQPRRLPHNTTEQAPVSTDFLEVAQDDGWTPLEGGRLVRVELPRSALGVFGMPVEEERGPERVQADVMLSHDGLLRAIRFVH